MRDSNHIQELSHGPIGPTPDYNKKPGQPPIPVLSSHPKPVLEDCPAFPRDLNNVSYETFHTLGVYIWHHHSQHLNQILGEGPSASAGNHKSESSPYWTTQLRD